MVSDQDLQKWQQAINDISATQNELLPEELSAFQTLTAWINSGNFAADGSAGYIQIL